MTRWWGPRNKQKPCWEGPVPIGQLLTHLGKSHLSHMFYDRIANEKLGNKLREQVKYIAKLTGEKE